VEIEFPRRLLITVASVLAVLVLILVGLVVSPRDADGRPLLLSPQRRAILQYLKWYREWTDRLADLESRLDELMPESTGRIQPAPVPGELYQRARQTEEVLRTASALQLEAERVNVPPPMAGLHNLVTIASQAHAAWAEAVVAEVGAPSPEGAAALADLRQAAVDTLIRLQEVE